MKYFAAVDLGTTSVEIAIINEDNEIIIKDGFDNPMIKYGSDVISRITNAKKGHQDEMRELIISGILTCLNKLSSLISIELSDICNIIVSGNSVMASIISGHPIDKMGEAPFEMSLECNEKIEISGINALVLSGNSAFLGADSILGALVLNLKDNDIVIDLGTNGEMILKNKGVYHAATAACGPAFENCTRAQKQFGSTTLSIISYAMQKKLLSPDMILSEEIINNGLTIPYRGINITLKANVLRDIQLAIAAIYTTLKLLITDSGLSDDEIGNLYISGGFGFYMKLTDAKTLGILPSKLIDKAIISGNTSLSGASMLLTNTNKLAEFENIKNNIILHQYGGNDKYESEFINALILKER